MIAKILPIFVLLVATHQAKVEDKSVNKDAETPKQDEKELPMSGIDPNEARCPKLGEEQAFLLLPHFTDCSKFFMCVHGEEVEFSCAAGGLYFDFALQTCNWSWATQCTLRTPPEGGEIDEGSGEGGLSFLADHAESGAVGVLTGDAVANNIRPPSVEYSGSTYNGALNCLRADSAPRMMPYKNDCQRYWHCVNGVAKTAYCSDGLYFNDLKQQCDFEANVKCHVEQIDELKSEFLLSK